MKIPIRRLFQNLCPGGSDPGKSTYDAFQLDLAGKDGTVREFIELARGKDGELFGYGAEELSRVLFEILSDESCEVWFARTTEETPSGLLPAQFIQPLAPFVWERDWSLEKNATKLSLYRMAAFMEYFRPGEFDWRLPNLEDMRTIEMLRTDFQLNQEHGALFIRHLSDTRFEVKAIAVGRKRLTPEDQKILDSNAHLRGKKLAEALGDEGFAGWPDLDPVEVYNKNPGSFRAQLSRWKKEFV